MKVFLRLKKSTYLKQINYKVKSPFILDGIGRKSNGNLILNLVLTPLPTPSYQLIKKLKNISQRDEQYVIDLCDRVLKHKASRQYRFDFLCGDTGVKLPVDAYYKDLNLVVEYYEKQHTESVKIFNRMTISGVSRDEQRRIYDERRKEVLPQHGINVVVISYSDFKFDSRMRIIGNEKEDLEIVCSKLEKYLK